MINAMIPFARLNEMMDSLWSESQGNGRAAAQAQLTPWAEVLEGEKEYMIRMDLPGVSREELQLEIENQELRVAATRKMEAPEGFRHLHGGGTGEVVYRRVFTLGRGIDANGIAARLDRGCLTITLPKSEQALPRKIEIK